MQLFFIVISYPFINHIITFEECKSTGTSFKSDFILHDRLLSLHHLTEYTELQRTDADFRLPHLHHCRHHIGVFLQSVEQVHWKLVGEPVPIGVGEGERAE